MNKRRPTNQTTWKKWLKFLETYHVPRLNHEEIKNLNRPTMNKEI